MTYPDDAMVLGRDLGQAIDIGPAMTRKVLKTNGRIVYKSTVRSLTLDELADKALKKRREEFTERVNVLLGDGFKYEDFINDPDLESFDTPAIHERYPADDDEFPPTKDADDGVDVDTYDQYVGAEVTLPIGDRIVNARVRGRKIRPDSSPIGKLNANPILDTCMYEVEFADGQTADLGANVIAQIMYAMCDTEGNQFMLLSGIVDHRKDATALEHADMYIKCGSNIHYRKTTNGWKLCVEWKDGSTSWERLADLK